MRLGSLSAILIGVAALAAAQVARAETGRTSGTFDVSSSGAATYSIPIWAPAGTNGIVPEISLNYSSSGDNGLMGVGWTLGGLSAIERCQSTTAQDGTPREILLDANDKLCLNGNRLRLTGTLPYGTLGSTYQTEFADFSEVKITAMMTSPETGPATFVVRTKEGLTLTYGATANSRALAFGATVAHRWKLEKVSDRWGNNFVVEYTGSNADGHKLPETIRWARTSATASDYLYSMTFLYEVRPLADSSTGYVAGYPISNLNRLKAIRINNTSGSTPKLVRKYALRYDTGPTTALSRLTAIQECADDAEQQCLSATSLAYQNGPGPSTTRNATEPASATLQAVADFNGDGKDDLVYLANGQWKVLFGANGALGIPVVVTGLTATVANVEVDNFLPNGRGAFLANIGGTLHTFVATDGNNDGIWEFTGGVSTGIATPTPFPRGVDYNGDGRADLMWVDASGTNRFVRMRDNTTAPGAANPTFAAAIGQGKLMPKTTSDGGTVQGASVQTGRHRDHFDKNGDGVEDVYLQMSVSYGSSGVTYSAVLRGAFGLEPFSAWRNSFAPNVNIGNFNDDNCNDIYNGFVAVSKCTDAAPQEFALPLNVTAAMIIGGADWDGDGRTDLLVNNGSVVAVALSAGNGFGPLKNTTFPAGAYFTLDLDGDKLPDLARVNGGTIQYHTRANGTGSSTLFVTHLPDLLSSVTDGSGVVAYADYVSTAQNNYLPGTIPVPSPLTEMKEPLVVVGRARHTDGVGGTLSATYTYAGARFDSARGNFVGFEEFHEQDSSTGFVTKTYFEQIFPKVGMPWKTEQLTQTGKVLSRIVTTNDPGQLSTTLREERYFPHPTGVVATAYDPNTPANATPLTTTTTTFAYDELTYGNVRTVSTVVTDGDSSENSLDAGRTFTSTRTFTYEPAHTDNWCVSLVTRSESVDSSQGETSITVAADYRPDVTNCRPDRETVQSENGTYNRVTDFLFDDFGNIRSKSVVGKNPDGNLMQPRASTADWGTSGQFTRSSKNALLEETKFDFNPDFGLLKSIEDPNHLVTSIEYDLFGRRTLLKRPDGTATKLEYTSCGSSCANTLHKTTITQSELNADAAHTVRTVSEITYLDQFDRPLVVRTKLLNGNYQWVEMKYDARGQLSARGVPCESALTTITSCTSRWTSYEYDDAGRIVSLIEPRTGGGTAGTTYEYVGRKTTIRDAQERTRITMFGPTGLMRRSIDSNGYFQTFTYDLAENLKDVTGQTVTGVPTQLFSASYEFGAGAFQVSRSDSASGTLTQKYNSLGELVEWTDAENKTVRAEYDALSRLTRREAPDDISEYHYGTNPGVFNVGRMISASSTAGGNYSETFEYDNFSRLKTRQIDIPTLGPSIYRHTYDPNTGRPDSLEYPFTGPNSLVIRYAYQNDILSSITNANDSNAVVWSAQQSNARGQITEERLGSGIISTGALTRKQVFETETGWVKSIRTGTASNEIAIQGAGYGYDLVGNLTRRENDKVPIAENFVYGNGTDRLYRLDHSTLENQPGENLRFTYDAIGNILTRIQPGVTEVPRPYEILWNTANFPTEIAVPNLAAPTEVATFAYGPDRNRWKMRYRGGAVDETTYYIGDELERVEKDGIVRFRHYVKVGEQTVAIYDRVGSAAPAWKFEFSDLNGSVDSVIESSGAVAANMAFSAYGDRRSPTTWSGRPNQAQTEALDAITRQGFNAETMLGSLGMVHFGGRVLDSTTGRFLSPDPLISRPGNTQDYNYYSYVYNNPLTLTDPSGLGEGDDDINPRISPFPEINPYCPNILYAYYVGPDGRFHRFCVNVLAPYDYPLDGRGDVGVITSNNNDTTLDRLPPGIQQVNRRVCGPLPQPTPCYMADVSQYKNPIQGYAYGSDPDDVYEAAEEFAQEAEDKSALKKTLFTEIVSRGLITTTSGEQSPDLTREDPQVVEAGIRGGAKGFNSLSKFARLKALRAIAAGKRGETRVRMVHNIGAKPTKAINMAGRGRIPDGLTRTVLSEVKNVKYQGYTRQLRDYVAYAQQTGRRVDLYVRPGPPGIRTDLSQPLKDAINKGLINLRYIP